MTCEALFYISEQAKNCISNPPSGEGCEICVPTIFSNHPYLIMVVGILLSFIFLYVIVRLITATLKVKE